MESVRNEYGDVIYKSKNKHGQYLNLVVQREAYGKTIHWYVVFWIGKRNKGFQYLKQTGKDGISSLLWAKECIVDFLQNVKKTENPQYLCIGWDDTRRKKVYLYGLRDLGFEIRKLENKICLCKTF